MATCSHLRLRHKHLDIRDHVHVDGARSILSRTELGGDDDDHAVPGFVHAHDDGNDYWGCHEPEGRRAPRQLGGGFGGFGGRFPASTQRKHTRLRATMPHSGRW